jgi:hypothetical protein
VKAEHQGYRRLLRTKRKLEDARAMLDMLAHRLRDDGPEMSRKEIRDRVTKAAGWLNEIQPRSPLRDEQTS